MIWHSPGSAAAQFAGSGAGYARSANDSGQLHRPLGGWWHAGAAFPPQLPGQSRMRAGKVTFSHSTLQREYFSSTTLLFKWIESDEWCWAATLRLFLGLNCTSKNREIFFILTVGSFDSPSLHSKIDTNLKNGNFPSHFDLFHRKSMKKCQILNMK